MKSLSNQVLLMGILSEKQQEAELDRNQILDQTKLQSRTLFASNLDTL